MNTTQDQDLIITAYGPNGGKQMTLCELAGILADIQAGSSTGPVVVVPPADERPPVAPPVPDPVQLDYKPIGTINGDVLTVCALGGIVFPLQRLGGTPERFMVRGANVVRDYSGVKLNGGPLPKITAPNSLNFGLDEPADFEQVRPVGFQRRYFGDGGKYFERSEKPDEKPPGGGAPPIRDIPATNPSTGPKPDRVPPVSTGPRGELVASDSPSKLSDEPWGYDRQQFVHPPYENDWVYKSEEIAVENAPGFPNETPDGMLKHGHNVFSLNWFYGDENPPFGLPKKNYRLSYEVTGGVWDPYRTVFDVLVTDMQTIGENVAGRIGQFNTVDQNGLIDGVPTVVQAHFNPEYAWFEAKSNNPKNNWEGLSNEQRQRTFINYANDKRVESFQQVYDRGGVQEVNYALHQKWRNVFGLSIQIMNRHSKPLRAFYGDYKGIAEFHNLLYWNRPYSPSDLFSSDVNDASRFGEANEGCNHGKVVLNKNDEYDISGNLRQMAGLSHCYDYEWAVSMTGKDYDAYSRVRSKGNIAEWHDKMVPDLYRPYYRAFHALLTQYVRDKKGWPDHKVMWQTEAIYENSIFVDGREEGAWVPWTLDAQAPFAPCKIPLHPEVSNGIVYHSRMLLDGLFVWGAYRRQYFSRGRSENAHPTLHNVGHEGLQCALDTINQHRAFQPDTVKLNGNIAVWNADVKKFVSGDANQLMMANGRDGNGQPVRPVPLVTGVFSPSTGLEVYQVYAVHQNRRDQTPVRFKSPVDGKELNAVATGWGPTLWTRQGKAA